MRHKAIVINKLRVSRIALRGAAAEQLIDGLIDLYRLELTLWGL